MADQTRYVVVVKRENRTEQTYVLDGESTLDNIFAFINDRQLFGGPIRGFSVHRDESRQPSKEEIFERAFSTQAQT